MKEIKIRFDPNDLVLLDQQAAALGTSRAELIRSRSLVSNCNNGLTTADYYRLMSDATAYMRGDMPSRVVEHLVAYVITWMSSKSQPSKLPSSTD